MSHRVTERPVWDLDGHAWEDLPVGAKVFLCSYIQDEASENLESHVKRIVRLYFTRLQVRELING